jgi:phosphorylase kinase gamma subunit
VRRCIEKETGVEYAAKIIDLSNDSHDAGGEGGKTMLEATIEEVHILRMVAGHPYISEDYISVLHYVIMFMTVECMPTVILRLWF